MNLPVALGLWLANSCAAALFGYWLGRSGFGSRAAVAPAPVAEIDDAPIVIDDLRAAAESADEDFELAIADFSAPADSASSVWVQRIARRFDKLLRSGRGFERKLSTGQARIARRKGGVWPALASELSRHRNRVIELCGALEREISGSITPTAATVAALLAQVQSLAEQNRRLRQELVEVKARLAEREERLSEAERQARLDALTRLPNRRSFDERLAAAQTRAEAGIETYALILFDLDRFKDLNDELGHPFGDAVLSVFGRILTDTIRASDHAARFGGEEFAVLLPGADTLAANAVAERCRRQAETSIVRRGDTRGAFTVSGGVAAWEQGRTAEEVLSAADRALYAAKADGRNRVHLAPTSAASETDPAVALTSGV
ncbi:MAG: diguanylate cyclase [Planctomycetaceae bacterium]|nr:diguanylate cyclase [Planctomycetaceae bacterium]